MIKNTLVSVEEFSERRQRFIAQMPQQSVAVFAANHEVTRSNDTEYLFCQHKNFYYLTGFNEPDALLVLIKNNEQDNQSILFCREKNALEEVWQGRRIGPELAQLTYQMNEAYPIAEIDTLLPKLLANKSQVLTCLDKHNQALESNILTWLKAVKAKSRQGISAPTAIVDCANIIDELRLIKSETELTIMRKANVISGLAHQRAMQKTAVGKFEYQIEAEILHEFARHGARFPAYNSIVAGGDNANILHYTANDDVLRDNELLLIDAGAEYAGYAADITRTFPINGKFSDAQKVLYQIVLDAQNIAIAAIKPGMTLALLNDIANRVITQGLMDIGILQGDLDTLLSEKACKKYFIHGLGHWLGLDVHDVGDYGIDQNKRQSRAFVPGMVMTIEPGLYIPLDDESVAPKWRGIGIRIEDNILVTANGYENLTVNAPKTIADIEQLMAAKHHGA